MGRLAQEMPPCVHPRLIDADGQSQALVGCFGVARVEPKLPRVVPRAQEPCILPRPGKRALDQPRRQAADAAGYTIRPPADRVDDGPVAWKVIARGNPIEVGRPARIRYLAGQNSMHGQQVGYPPNGTWSGHLRACSLEPQVAASARTFELRLPPYQSA